MKTKTKAKLVTHTALLMALTILLAATPLGYIPLNPLITITIMVTPVVLGGLLHGWPVGLVLGLVFGVTSFIRAPGEALGQLMLSQSVALTFIACVGPRLLVGLTGAAAYALMRKYAGLRKMWFYVAIGLAGSMVNTLCFLGVINLMFDSGQTDITGAVIWGIVSFNGIIEAMVNGVLVGVLCRAAQSRVKP